MAGNANPIPEVGKAISIKLDEDAAWAIEELQKRMGKKNMSKIIRGSLRYTENHTRKLTRPNLMIAKGEYFSD